MHAVFDGTIHFPKFSLILILRFIRPFRTGIYTLLSSTTYEQSIQWPWCNMPLLCQTYFILAHTPIAQVDTQFCSLFFLFWRIQLIRISHLNTFFSWRQRRKISSVSRVSIRYPLNNFWSSPCSYKFEFLQRLRGFTAYH